MRHRVCVWLFGDSVPLKPVCGPRREGACGLPLGISLPPSASGGKRRITGTAVTCPQLLSLKYSFSLDHTLVQCKETWLLYLISD